MAPTHHLLHFSSPHGSRSLSWLPCSKRPLLQPQLLSTLGWDSLRTCLCPYCATGIHFCSGSSPEPASTCSFLRFLLLINALTIPVLFLLVSHLPLSPFILPSTPPLLVSGSSSLLLAWPSSDSCYSIRSQMSLLLIVLSSHNSSSGQSSLGLPILHGPTQQGMLAHTCDLKQYQARSLKIYFLPTPPHSGFGHVSPSHT